MKKPLSYKPSAFYYRQELRQTDNPEDLRKIGMHLCAELEQLKAWVRSRGDVPPKWNLMQSEIEAKNWASVVPLRSEDQCAPAGLPLSSSALALPGAP